MINHNDSMDEAMRVLETSSCPIAQAFCRKWRDEMGMTMAELEDQLEEIEDHKDARNQLADELAGAEGEVARLEKVEIELNGRIESCSHLLWRFRPDVPNRAAKDFGDEYDWSEYPDEIVSEYAPDYEEVQAAFVLVTDGEVEEVWVMPKQVDRYSKHAPYERVF